MSPPAPIYSTLLSRKRKTRVPALSLDGAGHRDVAPPHPALGSVSWLLQAPPNLGGGGERRSSFCSGVYEFTSFYLNLSLSVFSCPRRNCPTTLGNKYYQQGQRLLQEPSLLQDKQASGGVQTFLTAHRGQSQGSPP